MLIKVTMVTSRIWANLILNYFLIYCHQNYSQEDGYIGQQIRYHLINKMIINNKQYIVLNNFKCMFFSNLIAMAMKNQ